MWGIYLIFGMLIYLMVGAFFNGVFNEEWQNPSSFFVIVWPIMVITFVIIFLFGKFYDAGQMLIKRIKEKHNNKGAVHHENN